MMLRAATDREQRPYALQLGQSCLHGSQVPLNVPSRQPLFTTSWRNSLETMQVLTKQNTVQLLLLFPQSWAVSLYGNLIYI